jgi:hypothetical protein
LPNSTLTPGAASAVTSTTVCKGKYQKTVKATASKQTAQSVFTGYQIPKKRQGKYSIDFLIPAGLGGSATPKNLWPIPTSQVSKKQAVNQAVIDSVCSGFVSLQTAQTAVASHWPTIAINPNAPTPTVSVNYFFTASGTSFIRFAATISNPGLAPLAGAVIQWTAFDVSGALVGSHTHYCYPINALSSITYVGGAGSATFTGTPVKVTATVKEPGSYGKTVPPSFPVTTVQLAANSFNLFTNATTYKVTADVTIAGTETVTISDLDLSIVLLDASGNIVGADFDEPTNLPTTLTPGTKIAISTTVAATAPPTSASISVGVDPSPS